MRLKWLFCAVSMLTLGHVPARSLRNEEHADEEGHGEAAAQHGQRVPVEELAHGEAEEDADVTKRRGHEAQRTAHLRLHGLTQVHGQRQRGDAHAEAGDGTAREDHGHVPGKRDQEPRCNKEARRVRDAPSRGKPLPLPLAVSVRPRGRGTGTGTLEPGSLWSLAYRQCTDRCHVGGVVVA